MEEITTGTGERVYMELVYPMEETWNVDIVENAIQDQDNIVQNWIDEEKVKWVGLLCDNKPMTKSQIITWAIKKMNRDQQEILRLQQHIGVLILKGE
tara:strand:+ start:231 stop:521 length:291 start_codon:yes stop_codon:yes gene_type:complete